MAVRISYPSVSDRPIRAALLLWIPEVVVFVCLAGKNVTGLGAKGWPFIFEFGSDRELVLWLNMAISYVLARQMGALPFRLVELWRETRVPLTSKTGSVDHGRKHALLHESTISIVLVWLVLVYIGNFIVREGFPIPYGHLPKDDWWHSHQLEYSLGLGLVNLVVVLSLVGLTVLYWEGRLRKAERSGRIVDRPIQFRLSGMMAGALLIGSAYWLNLGPRKMNEYVEALGWPCPFAWRAVPQQGVGRWEWRPEEILGNVIFLLFICGLSITFVRVLARSAPSVPDQRPAPPSKSE